MDAQCIVKIDPHGHGVGSHAAHGPEGEDQRGAEPRDGDKRKADDIESLRLSSNMDETAAAQILGVFILEFGVVLHRYDTTVEPLSHLC